MSEQQFEVFQECEYLEEWSSCPYCIKYDGETVFETLPLGIAKEVCKKLNEQQATIEELERKLKKYAKIGEEQLKQIMELQDLCGQSDSENAKLRQEIKELKAKLREKEVNLLRPTNLEQFEQIQKLQEENEKLKQKVDFYKYFQKDARELEKENEKLRENLHNCRLNKNIISEKLKLWQDVHKEYDIYSIKDFEELMKNDK